MWNAGLDESQAGIKIAGRNINLRYANDTTLMAESKEDLKSILVKVKEESEKAGWKLKTFKIQEHGFQYRSFMANRWGNKGKSDRLYFLGLQHHRRWRLQTGDWKTLALWRKSYDQSRQHINKQRRYFGLKVCMVNAMVFLVVMYGCESWTRKLSARELMHLNCGVGEDSWESLGLQGEQTSPS